MSKTNDKNEHEYYAPNPKESFANMIYNPKEGTFFGRTGKSWGQLLLFYTIFYIILAALFAICMQGLFASLDSREPKWKLDSSLIGTNPGLGFRPLSEQTERGSVIRFNTRKEAEADYWIELINDFLKDYNKTEGGPTAPCDFDQHQKVCNMNIKDFGDCSESKNYGYKTRQPCIFLKLNKIYGWKPDFYDNPEDLPEDMPESLKAHINATNPQERKQVWVTCNGHLGKDKELFDNISFYPSPGFPAYYYPYLNQNGYLSPLVAVQFKNLPAHAMMDVECRAWAKNVVYSGSNRDRMGSVTFQLLVDAD